MATTTTTTTTKTAAASTVTVQKAQQTGLKEGIFMIIELLFEFVVFFFLARYLNLRTALGGVSTLVVLQFVLFAFYLYVGPKYGNSIANREKKFTLSHLLLCALNLGLTSLMLYGEMDYVISRWTSPEEGGIGLIAGWCIAIPVCVLSDEVWFYYLHRLGHWSFIYAKLHKVHHAFQMTHPIAAYYAHPLDHCIVVIFSSLTGPLLLATFFPQYVHFSAIMCWHLTGMFHFTQGHCGYEFKNLPRPLRHILRADDFHEVHHMKFNYNYGNLIFLDYLHGTDYSPK
eukprot:CAMPEP_0201531680 /NCGR_PEP_ID=MMETSP0161_2-20130828/48336_1 /ASSEMBLY_ACC=CAM_ASM_000251 /TAXON_ID=180227 /ORGANISM="Neoparamoeba aestuarina, Strain SoJaBio B1-5/56/2" /LENGTH=284 /DNA_ID=CAMNT_0047934723 /DNA_START=135 /DNA_END=986 /DNA_ORIENTATION=+